MWQAAFSSTVTKYTHGEDLANSAAQSYCETLDLGLYGDWRLPTNAELTALIGDSIDSRTDAPYWTSDSAFARTPRSVDFSTHDSTHSYDTEALHVRCVR